MNRQGYTPANSKLGRQLAQAKGAKIFQGHTLTQSIEVAEWNARIAAKNKMKMEAKHDKTSSAS